MEGKPYAERIRCLRLWTHEEQRIDKIYMQL